MGVDRKVLHEGNGVKPKKGDEVTVHCTGYIAEGRKKFWSTLDDNKEFSFRVGLGQVIRGWDEGVLQMSIGEKAELTLSSDYAYGERGFPAWGINPNAALIFEIQLLKIN
ncbi:FKBP-type peptidyl-prolyl cis-trans isomerase domain [Trypanosoma melophagium]|uniref:FKBP-type peptidyl-prolyl cis-trans isomerase domain n=1 Tax=Trypanosoma melophagium TaxID=715481 RepID=UPI00351A5DF4|nr:FKBP-type peptidyl-prolyl cis-trans isomerase domain [Trypanosoma melophagium]